MKDRRSKAESYVKEHLKNQKHLIVRSFSAIQIEEMLKSSTKSVAKEIMSCLFIENSGILSSIIKWLASSSIKPNSKQKTIRRGSITIEDFEKNSKKYFLFSPANNYQRSTSYIIKSLQKKIR